VRTCPNCGASVADTDEFCGNCGTYLGWLQPETEEARPETEGAPPEPAAAPTGPAAADQPHAVAPARAVAQRRPRAAPQVAEPTQDGPTCKVCGTVNPLGAKFCRRCGTSLIETEAAQPVSWWHRLKLPRWRRFWGSAGSAWPRRIVILVVAAALVAGGFLLYPVGANLWQGLLDKLSTPALISPSQTTGNAAVAGHPVTAAVDGVTNQYWGAPAVGDWAQFTFAQPFRLLGVVITSGASTDPTVFDQEARPTAVELDVTTSSGTTTTLSITLADKPGPQTTDTGISNVTSIRLVIRAATAQAAGQSIALGEIEFSKRS
jgi:ribosomal protein L40E